MLHIALFGLCSQGSIYKRTKMCDAQGTCSLIGPNFENDTAIQLNLAPSRQEVKHWNSNSFAADTIQWKFRVKLSCFLQLDRIEVGSCSHHKQPYQSLFRTEPRPPLQQGFGPVVLVCTRVRLMCSHIPKRNCAKGVNAPGFDSNELNKAGAKTPEVIQAGR